MTQIIKHSQLQESDFGLAGSDATSVILPLDEWLALEDRSGTGVWLDADNEVESIADVVNDAPVIALNFPAFSDGRSYSSANLLRRSLQYRGEIRAVGDVRVDQLEQMVRCGFDAFELADGQNTEKAIAVLEGFSFSYQATIDRDPLFQQRT